MCHSCLLLVFTLILFLCTCCLYKVCQCGVCGVCDVYMSVCGVCVPCLHLDPAGDVIIPLQEEGVEAQGCAVAELGFKTGSSDLETPHLRTAAPGQT